MGNFPNHHLGSLKLEANLKIQVDFFLKKSQNSLKSIEIGTFASNLKNTATKFSQLNTHEQHNLVSKEVSFQVDRKTQESN
jgi:hypothetical protein